MLTVPSVASGIEERAHAPAQEQAD
jgi:hypothetical protein